MKKLTISQVKAMFKKNTNRTIWMVPSKSFPNPGHPFNMAISYNPTKYSLPGLKSVMEHFDKQVTLFRVYNCNAEVGNRVHFYVEEN